MKIWVSSKGVVLGMALSVLSIGIYWYYGRASGEQISVDEILKEHLQTRFEEEQKTSKDFLLVRDRIITPDLVQDGRDPNNLILPYVSFGLLKDDEVSINSGRSDTIVYTDFHVKEAGKDSATHKIAWFIESPKAHAKGFRFLRRKRNRQQFDKVLTCYRPLLERGGPYVFAPVASTNVDPQMDIETLIKDKEKLLSIIASKKNWAVGHKLRHKAVKRFRNKIDNVLGSGYQWIEKTSEGLMKYKYSIVIENRRQDFYFTEKIIDCLMCGTVPIYWGCPSIGKFFNHDGIIVFENLDELGKILENLSEADYSKRLEAIRENFRIAHCYIYQDKYLKKELAKVRINK